MTFTFPGFSARYLFQSLLVKRFTNYLLAKVPIALNIQGAILLLLGEEAPEHYRLKPPCSVGTSSAENP